MRSVKFYNDSFKDSPSTSEKMTQSAYYYCSPTSNFFFFFISYNFFIKGSDRFFQHTRSVSVDPTPSSFHLSRNSARKSRFTDEFLNAKNRINSGLEENNILFDSSKNRYSKIYFDSDTINTPIGIEVIYFLFFFKYVFSLKIL